MQLRSNSNKKIHQKKISNKISFILNLPIKKIIFCKKKGHLIYFNQSQLWKVKLFSTKRK
jgi:hypothetical protein